MPTNSPFRVVAEVWNRSLLGIPGSDPLSRHCTTAEAQRACARANYLSGNPDGHYPTPDGQPPYSVYAIRTHDRCVEVPPTLTPDEEATVHIIRALMVLSPRPDPAVVDAVLATAAEAHTHGHPFNQHAVLATLYPCQKRTHHYPGRPHLSDPCSDQVWLPPRAVVRLPPLGRLDRITPHHLPGVGHRLPGQMGGSRPHVPTCAPGAPTVAGGMGFRDHLLPPVP